MAKVFDSEHEWNIYSSNGWCSVGVSFKESVKIGDYEFIRSEFFIRGMWPDRASRNLDFCDPPLDFDVKFSALLLRIDKLRFFLESRRISSKT